ncbi:hypothetical protein [Tropicimonas marinistellae]|uniref:hypothetical protein n=1 Tax=Tropicimonas marinistellae TaxID=1739787 RepID=UPI00082BCBD5|nr:hypothetical protein [Tropicimonas marinistellae]
MTGGIQFEALGKVQTIKVTFLSIAKFERSVGSTLAAVLDDVQNSPTKIGFSIVLHFYASCLNKGNGAPEVRAGAVLEEIGITRGAEMMMEAIADYLPDAEDAGDGSETDEGDEGNALAAG